MTVEQVHFVLVPFLSGAAFCAVLIGARNGIINATKRRKTKVDLTLVPQGAPTDAADVPVVRVITKEEAAAIAANNAAEAAVARGGDDAAADHDDKRDDDRDDGDDTVARDDDDDGDEDIAARDDGHDDNDEDAAAQDDEDGHDSRKIIRDEKYVRDEKYIHDERGDSSGGNNNSNDDDDDKLLDDDALAKAFSTPLAPIPLSPVITQLPKPSASASQTLSAVLTAPKSASAASRHSVEPTVRMKDRKILLAEDTTLNRELITMFFDGTGVNFDFAENGLEAVTKFEADPNAYSLILMDIQMPEMDGYEAAQMIRAHGDPWSKQIPIIAMTGNTMKEDIDACFNAGMDDHVAKPINTEELVSKVFEFINANSDAE